MKKILFISAVLAVSLPMLSSCKKDGGKEGKVESLKIESLEITSGEAVSVPGKVTFTAKISDASVNLSTLEVSAALENGTVLATASIRTPGKEAVIEDGEIAIPFAADMAEGGTIGITFEAINVDGASVKQSKLVSLHRPSLPETLYMTAGDAVYPMARDLENPLLYRTESATGFDNSLTAFISSAEEPAESDYIWVASDIPGKGRIGTVSDEGISVSFPSYVVENWAFDAGSFEITPIGRELHISVAGTPLSPAAGLLYASVTFTKDATVEVEGMDDVATAYNRDFFSYEGGELRFLRESGTYDVYYSPKYNYIWVAKMTSVAPECYWVLGHGFTCATAWHRDYFKGGWSETDITRMGYAVKTAEDSWQCSMYISNEHEWESCEFEIYSDLDWGKGSGIELTSLTGDTKGLVLSKGSGITSSAGFQPGYYVFTFHASTKSAEIRRISDWQDSGDLGVTVNGTRLESDASGFAFADIAFTKGAEVTVSGIDDLAAAYNRDFFSYEGGKLKFLRESGTWSVRYYPDYNYIWVINESLAYPDCLYVLGNGKMSCPSWFNSLGAPSGNFYLKSLPYMCVAPAVGSGVFQATMYLSTDNDWKDVRIEFYSEIGWGKEKAIRFTGAAITGDAADMFEIVNPGEESCNLHSIEDKFVDGYYRVTLTAGTSGSTIEINKAN